MIFSILMKTTHLKFSLLIHVAPQSEKPQNWKAKILSQLLLLNPLNQQPAVQQVSGIFALVMHQQLSSNLHSTLLNASHAFAQRITRNRSIHQIRNLLIKVNSFILISLDHSKPQKAIQNISLHFSIPNKKSSTVCAAFSIWVKEFQNKGINIQYLRTDGGGEYQKDLTPVLKALGVTHQPTAPYSPQSNGKAERLNRSLIEPVKAMLYYANMPETFWAEAMSTAATIHNYLPSEAIDNQIPWERWHEKQLSVETLRILHPFGSIVHVYVPRQRRRKQGKLAIRSTVGCLVGYQLSSSNEPSGNYKFWDFERKTFDLTHNLIFTNKFPKSGDFDEPPAAPPLPPAAQSTPELQDFSNHTPLPPISVPQERPIYDMITVELPPALQVFASYSKPPDNDPPTLTDALRRSDAQNWINAMKEELQSIKDNQTWCLCDLPPGRKYIGTKWVFKMKRDGNNNPMRYKTRLVAKGYSQIAGINFDKTFAPVVRIESIRCLLAFAAFFNLDIKQIDCKTAFLNGNSDLEIYVQQPEGFSSRKYPRKVLRLNKSLYGLKQAPRIWYLLLCSVIQNLGFIPLESDTSIYVAIDRRILIAVYVDDILIFGQKSECDEVFNQLKVHFKMEDLDYPKTFLGLNIIRHENGSISINQAGYIDRMLNRFKMMDAKIAKTPLDPSLPLLKADTLEKRIVKCAALSRTHWLSSPSAVFSRPDISNSVSQPSQFLQNPTETHIKAARQVLRYLKGTHDLSITYGSSQEFCILGVSDANWGGDKNDRKPTTGYIFMINNGAVSWTSHKQSTVATSTMEAEYMALSDASHEAIARTQLYAELRLKISPPLLFSDNARSSRHLRRSYKLST